MKWPLIEQTTEMDGDADIAINTDTCLDYFEGHCSQQVQTDSSSNKNNNNDTNTVTIDVSNPIQLAQNSLIVVNGQKCVLQQQATGQLFAYPVKEPTKPKKKRGRPKKAQHNVEQMQDTDNIMKDDPLKDQQSNSIEKGLVETSNEAGETVKRSTRKRNMAKVLGEYETGSLPLECGDEGQVEQCRKRRTRRGNKRMPVSRQIGPVIGLGPILQPVKRERGRPKRYRVPKRSQDSCAILVRTDGVHVPSDTGLGNTASRDICVLGHNSNMPLNAALPMTATVITIPRKNVPIKIGLKATENDLGKLKCPKCEFQAYYRQQYQDHIRTHAADAHSCKCCAFVSLEERELVQHYKDTHPKCICSVCNHTADQAYIIRRHMHSHSSGGESATCETCGKTYKNHYIMRTHVRMVHSAPDVVFECETCHKKFKRKAHLNRHLRTHEAERPFKCPQCDYKCCERADVAKHRLVHEQPQHTCEVCCKTFRHLRNKELHVKRHKGQRDYKCGVCEYFGYTFTDIRKHIERKHATSNVVICERCGQAFECETSLHEHANSRQCEMLMLEQVLREAENSTLINAGQEDDSATAKDSLQDIMMDDVASEMLGEVIIEADTLDSSTTFLSQDAY